MSGRTACGGKCKKRGGRRRQQRWVSNSDVPSGYATSVAEVALCALRDATCGRGSIVCIASGVGGCLCAEQTCEAQSRHTEHSGHVEKSRGRQQEQREHAQSVVHIAKRPQKGMAAPVFSQRLSFQRHAHALVSKRLRSDASFGGRRCYKHCVGTGWCRLSEGGNAIR